MEYSFAHNVAAIYCCVILHNICVKRWLNNKTDNLDDEIEIITALDNINDNQIDTSVITDEIIIEKMTGLIDDRFDATINKKEYAKYSEHREKLVQYIYDQGFISFNP
jgi:hypothetical protein